MAAFFSFGEHQDPLSSKYTSESVENLSDIQLPCVTSGKNIDLLLYDQFNVCLGECPLFFARLVLISS